MCCGGRCTVVYLFLGSAGRQWHEGSGEFDNLYVAQEMSPRSGAASSRSRITAVVAVVESGGGEEENSACFFTFHIFVYRHFFILQKQGGSQPRGGSNCRSMACKGGKVTLIMVLPEALPKVLVCPVIN